MVRTYKKKRTKPEVSEEVIEKAMEAVRNGTSLRAAADLYGMDFSALFYRLKKSKAINSLVDETRRCTTNTKCYSSKYTSQQIFNVEQETLLCEYIIKCSVLNYGLTYRQIRQLAFDYAKRLNLKIPSSWDKNKISGIDWVKGFMKRHPQLTLRKPENTSFARATAFNKANVAEFFDNYERALNSGAFTAEHIYNLDETGVLTVVQAPNVVAKLGARQVGQAVSGERGSMITMCMIINALGNTVPPVFIFPRARFHDSMLFGAPTGSLGLANSSKSGYMIGPLFLEVLKHIKKHTRCSVDNKILLVMDNHESHCTLDAVLFAKDNGIVLVTFPPHCSHRLQPLDVGVLGPFKSKLRVAQNDWMVSNPGKTISIHNLAGLANTAYAASFTSKNITAAFQKTGIWPFSRLVFTDEDFEPSSVTVNSIQQVPVNSIEILPDDSIAEERCSTKSLPSTSKENPTFCTPIRKRSTESKTNEPRLITPVDVRPYPKAIAQAKKGGRKKGKSKILTETPEKNRIEEETIKRLEKKKKSVSNEIKLKSKPPKKLFVESSDSECADDISLHDESECEDFLTSTTTEFEEQMDFEITDDSVIEVNDFVLVEFCGKKKKVLFVGKIEEIEEDGYKVQFMRKKEDSWKFYFPEKEDISSIERNDIKMKLPQPNLSGGTARAVFAMTFSINFDLIKDKIM